MYIIYNFKIFNFRKLSEKLKKESVEKHNGKCCIKETLKINQLSLEKFIKFCFKYMSI